MPIWAFFAVLSPRLQCFLDRYHSSWHERNRHRRQAFLETSWLHHFVEPKDHSRSLQRETLRARALAFEYMDSGLNGRKQAHLTKAKGVVAYVDVLSMMQHMKTRLNKQDHRLCRYVRYLDCMSAGPRRMSLLCLFGEGLSSTRCRHPRVEGG